LKRQGERGGGLNTGGAEESEPMTEETDSPEALMMERA
jgi:hypothetical protein